MSANAQLGIGGYYEAPTPVSHDVVRATALGQAGQHGAQWNPCPCNDGLSSACLRITHDVFCIIHSKSVDRAARRAVTDRISEASVRRKASSSDPRLRAAFDGQRGPTFRDRP